MRHKLVRSLYDEAPCGALVMKVLFHPHVANCDSCHEVVSWNRYRHAVIEKRLEDARAGADIKPMVKPAKYELSLPIIPTRRKRPPPK